MRSRIVSVSIAALLFMGIFAQNSSAWVGKRWNGPYDLLTVRQNGTGFWFQVVAKDANDQNKWFGCNNTFANYNTLVAVILAAKTSGRKVSFWVESDGLNGDPQVAYITGVDIH